MTLYILAIEDINLRKLEKGSMDFMVVSAEGKMIRYLPTTIFVSLGVFDVSLPV